jgi:hypothetical protein
MDVMNNPQRAKSDTDIFTIIFLKWVIAYGNIAVGGKMIP